MDERPTLQALRWRSRRGTRALDLILSHFLATGYEDLTPEQRRAYARLLDMPDPELVDCLLGETLPSEPEIAGVVRAIREKREKSTSG